MGKLLTILPFAPVAMNKDQDHIEEAFKELRLTNRKYPHPEELITCLKEKRFSEKTLLKNLEFMSDVYRKNGADGDEVGWDTIYDSIVIEKLIKERGFKSEHNPESKLKFLVDTSKEKYFCQYSYGLLHRILHHSGVHEEDSRKISPNTKLIHKGK